MAAPSVWGNSLDDGPLKPADLPSRAALEALWDQTEADVAASAWQQAADALPSSMRHRSHTDAESMPRRGDTEADIFRSAFED